MIAFVKGELDSVLEDRVIVENNGMGFEILVPKTVLHNMPHKGGTVKIYTYTYVREDALSLYGFLTRDELNMFKLLITVNGIGPKGALGILSVMDSDTLRFAILSEDAKGIAKAPGLGLKTASKLILELKDKCNLEDLIRPDRADVVSDSVTGNNQVFSDAVQALVALGYSSQEAMKAIKSVTITEDSTVEDLLKASLKNI